MVPSFRQKCRGGRKCACLDGGHTGSSLHTQQSQTQAWEIQRLRFLPESDSFLRKQTKQTQYLLISLGCAAPLHTAYAYVDNSRTTRMPLWQTFVCTHIAVSFYAKKYVDDDILCTNCLDVLPCCTLHMHVSAKPFPMHNLWTRWSLFHARKLIWRKHRKTLSY